MLRLGQELNGLRLVHQYLIILLVVLLINLAGCSGGQEIDDESVHLDLISLESLARQRTETGDIVIDSSLHSFYFHRGWSPSLEPDEWHDVIRIAAIQENVALRFNVLTPVPRRLIFRAGLNGELGSLPRQRINIKFNNSDLPPLDMSISETREFSIDLPAELQHEGINRIIFIFDEFNSNEEYEQSTRRARWREENPGIAVYFSGFEIVLGADKESTELPEESDVVRIAPNGRALVQLPDSRIRYAFDMYADSILKIEGTAQANESGSYSAVIRTITDDAVEPTERWRLDVTPQTAQADLAFSEEISLGEMAGRPALIEFEVRAAGNDRSGGIVWRELSLTATPDDRAAREARERKPVRMKERIRNIVVVVLDALRADVVGAYGNTEGMTPEIDKFARSAVIFQDAVAPAPYTISSVSSLFSGLLPEAHGVRNGRDVYPEELQNLGQTLRDNGWFTVNLAGTQFLTAKYGITRYAEMETYLRSKEDKKEEIATMDMDKVAAGIIAAAESGRPSFIYIHLLPPHWPYRPPAPYDTRFIDSTGVDKSYLQRIRAFRGEADHPLVEELYLHYKNNIVYADALFGQVLEMLDANGMGENSVIVLTSDHGEAFAEHGALEHGNTVFDEMILVPFIVRVPGGEASEKEQQVSWLDFFPTTVELLDLPVGNIEFDGRSIAPLLAGLKLEPAPYYYSRAFSEKAKFTLRGERYKYIYNDGIDLLFDLKADSGERDNLAGNLPALTASLRQRGLLMILLNEKRAGNRGEVELTEEEENELRDLGYLQ